MALVGFLTLASVLIAPASMAVEMNSAIAGTVVATLSRNVPKGWVDCRLTIAAADCAELRKQFIFDTGHPDVPMYIIKLPENGSVDDLNRFLQGR